MGIERIFHSRRGKERRGESIKDPLALTAGKWPLSDFRGAHCRAHIRGVVARRAPGDCNSSKVIARELLVVACDPFVSVRVLYTSRAPIYRKRLVRDFCHGLGAFAPYYFYCLSDIGKRRAARAFVCCIQRPLAY